MNVRVLKDMLYEQVARVGKVLGSPKRLELMARGEKAVDALAAEVAIDVKLASSHLKTLREGRLVKNRRGGKRVLYRLSGVDDAQLGVAPPGVAEEHLLKLRMALQQMMAYPGRLVQIRRKELLAQAKRGEVVVLDVRPPEHGPRAVRAIRAIARARPAPGRTAPQRGHRCLLSRPLTPDVRRVLEAAARARLPRYARPSTARASGRRQACRWRVVVRLSHRLAMRHDPCNLRTGLARPTHRRQLVSPEAVDHPLASRAGVLARRCLRTTVQGDLDVFSSTHSSQRDALLPVRRRRSQLAIVVDVVSGDEQWFIADAVRAGVRIVHVIDTHVHAHHYSCGPELARRAAAPYHLYESDRSRVAFDFASLSNCQRIEAGNVLVDVIHTPEHTLNSGCFVVHDLRRGNEFWFMITGDTLFVGAVGRPDLTGREREIAEQLHHTLHEKPLQMPPELEIYPGDQAGSARGAGLSGKPASSIGFENHFNPMLSMSRRDFGAALAADVPPQPVDMSQIVEANLRGVVPTAVPA